MVSWINDKYDPDQLARRMESIKTINKKGQASFKGFEYREHITLLCSMLQFREEIPDFEKRKIIVKASFNAGSKGDINPKRLITEIGKLEEVYLKLPIKKYYLVTTISISKKIKIKRYNIDKCTIVFKSNLPKIFISNREKLIKHAQNLFYSPLPSHYMFVRVALSAKCEAEAADKAINSLDLLRGIWNLIFNRGAYRETFGGKPSPVNKFILGPVHTIHECSGKVTTETYWYDPHFRGAIKSQDNFENNINNVYNFTNNIRDQIGKSKYANKLKIAILRYTRALDIPDWHDSFLKLWGVLELLTNTTGDRYAVTVRRVSFLFSDGEYHKQILLQLQDARNRKVHSELEHRYTEAYMYQAKRYVESLLMFHLSNSFGFNNLEHAAQFMDQPYNKKEIMSKIRMMHYAKKFLGFK